MGDSVEIQDMGQLATRMHEGFIGHLMWLWWNQRKSQVTNNDEVKTQPYFTWVREALKKKTVDIMNLALFSFRPPLPP